MDANLQPIPRGLTREVIPAPQGSIAWRWDEVGGEGGMTSNVITYRAADVLARLLAGDTSYTPKWIAFVYAPQGQTFGDPDDAQPPRQHTLTSIATEVQSNVGNAILARVQQTVEFQSTDVGNYEGNQHTLLAIVDPDEGSQMWSAAGYTSARPQVNSDKYHQVLLLAEPTPGNYIPIARAPLGEDRSGELVRSGQLAVFWSIQFS